MKTKFGIVGCGFLGNIVADAWKKGLLEDYELVGVTSRTFASAEKTAASVGCAASADETTRTGLPGVFAAGDVREKQLRQIVTAVSDGAAAAQQAEHYLGKTSRRAEI